MTLTEAIKIVEDITAEPSPTISPKLRAAFEILIEAGKRVQEQRSLKELSGYIPLPGETEE